MPKTSALLAVLAMTFVVTDAEYEPAKLRSGALSAEAIQPPLAGVGQVFLELRVDDSGRVSDVTTLRSTPPSAELLADAVRRWQFAPARAPHEELEELVPVASRVLVAGLFRPATTYDAPALGQLPEDVASSSEEVPFPHSTVSPLYPPMATSHTGHVVLVEVEVGEEGNVTAARVIRSAPGFDEVSLGAARQWAFRPALRNGKPVPSIVYIVFGFREPVAS